MLGRFLMLLAIAPIVFVSAHCKRVKTLYVSLVVMYIWAYYTVLDPRWYQFELTRFNTGIVRVSVVMSVLWALSAAFRILAATSARLSSAPSAAVFEKDVNVGKRCVRVWYGKHLNSVTTREFRGAVAKLFWHISDGVAFLLMAWWAFVTVALPSKLVVLFPLALGLCMTATATHYSVGVAVHDARATRIRIAVDNIWYTVMPILLLVVAVVLGRMATKAEFLSGVTLL